jgi:hypothetical protein
MVEQAARVHASAGPAVSVRPEIVNAPLQVLQLSSAILVGHAKTVHNCHAAIRSRRYS